MTAGVSSLSLNPNRGITITAATNGTLSVPTGATLTLAPASSAAAISNTTGSLTATGGGTVFLNGSVPNLYTGGTIVNNNTLLKGTALSIPAGTGGVFGNGTATINNGTLQLVGTSLAGSSSVTTLTLGGNANLLVNGTAGGTTTFNVSSTTLANLVRNAGGTLIVTPTIAALGTSSVEQVTFSGVPASLPRRPTASSRRTPWCSSRPAALRPLRPTSAPRAART